MNPLPRKRFAWIIGAVVLLLALASTTIWLTRPESAQLSMSVGPTKADLIAACRAAVKAQLRAPGSAQFGDEIPNVTDEYGTVTGWVDAQNGFGALVRNRYACKAWRGATWRVAAEDVALVDW